MQLLQQLQAVEAGHADIADQHAGPVTRNTCSQALGVAKAEDLEPGQVEGLAERLAQMGVIVDQHHLDMVTDTVIAGHDQKSSVGWRLTPGLARRRRRVSSAPLSG